MSNLTFQSTSVTAAIVERLLKSRLKAEGLDSLPPGPIVFMMNHFTRAEAFLVPYVIQKYTHKYPRSLAHHSLFHGLLGEYFKRMDVFSTKDPERDDRIIRDLLTDDHRWTIYPEGSMVKSKKLIKRGKLHLSLPSRIGPPHTGGATLALKAELARRDFLQALDRNDVDAVTAMMRQYNLQAPDEVTPEPLHIIPVTITFYPLRPGQNILKKVITRFFKTLPTRLLEELEIEGNLLLKETDINLYFGQPIRVDEYLGRFDAVNRFLPFWRSVDAPNVLLKHCAKHLTTDVMHRVYTNLQVNLDHLYCMALRERRGNDVLAADLSRALYLATQDVATKTQRRLQPTLLRDVVRWLGGLPAPAVASVEQLASQRGIITSDGDKVRINHLALNMESLFHAIRIQNPIMVIANELEPLPRVRRLVTMHVNSSTAQLARQCHDQLLADDLRACHEERDANAPPVIALDHAEPFFLPAAGSRIGVVLAHGFLASPGEIRTLATYLNRLGINVYGVRLAGHGCRPEALAGVSWDAWYQSYAHGLAVLRSCCDQIVCGGFSTGGLLALKAAAESQAPIAAAFAINSPATLAHIQARLVPAARVWNDLLESVHLAGARLDLFATEPENRDTNYTQIHLNGLHQLKLLMRSVRGNLHRIQCPTLIGVGEDDPTVNPASSRKLFSRIHAPDSKLLEMPFSRHVIVRGPGCEIVFSAIHDFLAPILGVDPSPAVVHQLPQDSHPALLVDSDAGEPVPTRRSRQSAARQR